MTGLRDEGAVRITDGHAALGLPEASLPGRVGTVVQRRLDRLSPAARNLIQMAAVLGRSFALYDAAEMLDEPPAVLLPLVQEAVAGDVLAATQDAIIFRHELVRRAVTETLPQPLVQALHRQFGEILIQRGSSAIPAAGHLAAGGRRGDTLALAGLDRAARELLPASPHAAADLARRALDLTHPADPARFARSVAAIDALTAAGRLDAAAHLLHAELAQPLPAMDKAKLRGAWSSVLYLSGHPAAARAEAEAVLAEPRLPASLRDQTNVALLQARAGARDNQAVSDLADAILAAPAEHGYDAKVTAMTVLGVTKWDQGQMAEGLKLCREAARQTARGSVDARRFHPQLTLAARLIDARQLDDAAAVIQLASRHIEAAGHSVWAPVPAELRARIDLVQGRLDAANADAQAALRIAEEFETHIYDQLPLMVLATVALRRGDLGAAELHLRKADAARAPALGEAYTDQRRTILAAQIAEAQDGPQAALALALATGVYEDLRRHRWPLYEPVTAAWLVRVALAADDRDRAATAAAVAADIAADNPGYPVLTAVGDHARGLLDHDLARLEQAARHHVDVWARASAAEDVALLLAADRDTSSAIIRLDEALNGYEHTGATRDAARVRRRLRQVGARRRHWASAKRPVTGWTTLTSTERAISLLAAQGLTNQQIANQKFISVHTVAFHLRQIFRKLGIGSRVELARVAVRHDQTQE
jgi:DNA-binding CsgD family transcriptional regulator